MLPVSRRCPAAAPPGRRSWLASGQRFPDLEEDVVPCRRAQRAMGRLIVSRHREGVLLFGSPLHAGKRRFHLGENLAVAAIGGVNLLDGELLEAGAHDEDVSEPLRRHPWRMPR